jgi:7,8-dihydropterin-6-yl-methyl-4-(beta-D-ribofuranosyl)aminobenzene 5'-phosphate synthase
LGVGGDMKLTNTPIIVVIIYYISISAYPISLTAVSNPANIQSNEEATKDSIIITILYDNYICANGTQADWGFSCLIENTEKTILFDTGTDPDILIKNVNELNKDLNQVDVVVISHNHSDHTGGLFEVLKNSKNIDVYLPNSTPNSYMKKVEEIGATLFSKKDSISICGNCFLTGELGANIKEQSLILDSKNGLIVITGCSHPGIVNIVRRAKDILGKEVYMVFGGFHLMKHSSKMISEIITELKNLGVKKCGSTHCSGEEAIQIFKQSFGNNFIHMGTGQVIKIAS